MPREILDDCRVCLDIESAEQAVTDAETAVSDFELRIEPGSVIDLALSTETFTEKVNIYGDRDLARIALRFTKRCAENCNGKDSDGKCGRPELRAQVAMKRKLSDLA